MEPVSTKAQDLYAEARRLRAIIRQPFAAYTEICAASTALAKVKLALFDLGIQPKEWAAVLEGT